MQCIFCKIETSDREPIEHILPESIGNLSHTLRRGIVCRKCNNYFASKVEKPFLGQAPVEALRFHQAVPSKKGRVPIMSGILMPGNIQVELIRDAEDGSTSVRVPTEHFDAFANQNSGELIFLAPTPPKQSVIVSRFLAKVGMEAFAYRLQENDEWLQEITHKEELDLLRNHARYGQTREWPVSIREIYGHSARWTSEDLENYQIVHEFDFLFTDQHEVYFVLAIFGCEMVINMGGPDLEGWEVWLSQNENTSPLHTGKNLGKERMVKD